jgi:hypothetical protein
MEGLIQDVDLKTERNHLGDQSVDGRIWILEK